MYYEQKQGSWANFVEGSKPMAYEDQPVHEAARGEPERLKCLIEQDPHLVHVKAFLGQTPLHAAVEDNNIESINILLNAGADVNALDERGYPPAFEASSRKALETLAGAGARLDIYCKHGLNGFLHCARYIRNIETLDFWYELGEPINKDPQSGAAALVGLCSQVSDTDEIEEALQVIRYLLKKGADIDLQKRSDTTALIEACWNQTLPIVTLLLEAGADTNKDNIEGNTPLHYAITRKNEKLVELLLKHGGDINRPNRFHDAPIDLARNLNFYLERLEPLYIPKPIRPWPKAEDLIERLTKIPEFKNCSLQGCSEEEICKLEKHFNLSLPAVYRDFLRTLGKGFGSFMSSDHISFEFDQLFDQAQHPSYAEYCQLTAKSFVFAERGWENFYYFEADDSSDDPPVFMFECGEFGSRQVYRSFWEFIEDRVVDYEILSEGRYFAE